LARAMAGRARRKAAVNFMVMDRSIMLLLFLKGCSGNEKKLMFILQGVRKQEDVYLYNLIKNSFQR
jgi:hypothetical protein